MIYFEELKLLNGALVRYKFVSIFAMPTFILRLNSVHSQRILEKTRIKNQVWKAKTTNLPQIFQNRTNTFSISDNQLQNNA